MVSQGWAWGDLRGLTLRQLDRFANKMSERNRRTAEELKRQ